MPYTEQAYFEHELFFLEKIPANVTKEAVIALYIIYILLAVIPCVF